MRERELDNLNDLLLGVPSARQVHLSAGDVLIRQGDNADSVFLLISGALEVSRSVDSHAPAARRDYEAAMLVLENWMEGLNVQKGPIRPEHERESHYTT